MFCCDLWLDGAYTVGALRLGVLLLFAEKSLLSRWQGFDSFNTHLMLIALSLPVLHLYHIILGARAPHFAYGRVSIRKPKSTADPIGPCPCTSVRCLAFVQMSGPLVSQRLRRLPPSLTVTFVPATWLTLVSDPS